MPADSTALAALPPIPENEFIEDGSPSEALPPQGQPLHVPTETESDHETQDGAATEDEGESRAADKDGNLETDPTPGEGEDGTTAPNADELTPEQIALKADAEQMQQLRQAYGRNPAAIVAQLASTLPKAQYEAVMAALGVVTPGTATGQALADYKFQPRAEATPEEQFVQDHAAIIKEAAIIPQFKQDVNTWVDKAGAIVNQHTSQIDAVLSENAILRAQMDALIAHTGVKLPALDKDKIKTAVKSGKSHAEATEAVYGSKAKAAVKTAQIETPKTPENSGTSSGGSAPKSGDPFMNAFFAVKAAAKVR